MSLEALFATWMIDAHKEQEVITFDVPGDFLQPEIPKDKLMLMKLKGQSVDIMCNVNPEHTPNVTYENGKKYYKYRLYVPYTVALRQLYCGTTYTKQHWRN